VQLASKNNYIVCLEWEEEQRGRNVIVMMRKKINAGNKILAFFWFGENKLKLWLKKC
jgi:hypothetical protein